MTLVVFNILLGIVLTGGAVTTGLIGDGIVAFLIVYVGPGKTLVCP